MSEFQSCWRCDSDGESFVVSVQPVYLDEDGDVLVPAQGCDLLIEKPWPCPICGGDMRRIVSLADLRSWESNVDTRR